MNMMELWLLSLQKCLYTTNGPLEEISGKLKHGMMQHPTDGYDSDCSDNDNDTNNLRTIFVKETQTL